MKMNGCDAPRRTLRFLLLGVALALVGVSESYSPSAHASEFGVEGTDVAPHHKRGGQTATEGNPFAIPVTGSMRNAPVMLVAQGSGADPAVARLEVRLSELERDLRESTGKVEDLSHRVRVLSDRLEKLSSDVDYRLGQSGPAATGAVAGAGAVAGSTVNEARNQPLSPPSQAAGTLASRPGYGEGPTVLGRLSESEAKTAAAPPSVPEPVTPRTTSAQTAAALPEGTPREQYAYGYGLLRKANYDEAEVVFKEFLKENPNDPLAENARYWLGETYYAREDYAQAAETFLDAYQKNKAGPKAPDALLKLGMSLGRLNKIPEACATYNELKTALPDAPVSIKDRARKEGESLGCK